MCVRVKINPLNKKKIKHSAPIVMTPVLYSVYAMVRTSVMTMGVLCLIFFLFNGFLTVAMARTSS